MENVKSCEAEGKDASPFRVTAEQLSATIARLGKCMDELQDRFSLVLRPHKATPESDTAVDAIEYSALVTQMYEWNETLDRLLDAMKSLQHRCDL